MEYYTIIVINLFHNHAKKITTIKPAVYPINNSGFFFIERTEATEKAKAAAAAAKTLKAVKEAETETSDTSEIIERAEAAEIWNILINLTEISSKELDDCDEISDF